MGNIPEGYRSFVESLCRLYNVQNSGMGVSIDPKSISRDTNLKDIGLRRINMVAMETVAEQRYPAITGISDTPGIETVGDVIDYIEGGKRKAAASF
jgi:hypothetical protein